MKAVAALSNPDGSPSSTGSDPEAATGQLPMVKTRGPVERKEQFGKLDRKTPGVLATTGLPEGRGPPLPPGDGAAPDRLDDEDRGTAFGRLEKAGKESLPLRAVQLVQGEGGEHGAAVSR